MKCRFTYGQRSFVVSTTRSGVANLGVFLQICPGVDLFAICTEDRTGNRFWTTLWSRKVCGSIIFYDGTAYLPSLLAEDIIGRSLDYASNLDAMNESFGLTEIISTLRGTDLRRS